MLVIPYCNYVYHYVYNSYVLNAYLYCVYALVGGAISIRDPYICAVTRVCANESHVQLSSTGPLSVQLKRSYRLHARLRVLHLQDKCDGIFQ